MDVQTALTVLPIAIVVGGAISYGFYQWGQSMHRAIVRDIPTWADTLPPAPPDPGMGTPVQLELRENGREG